MFALFLGPKMKSLISLLLATTVFAGVGFGSPSKKNPRIDLVDLPEPKWVSFGLYLQPILEGIYKRWRSTSFEESDQAKIRVEFVLKSDGEIVNCRVLESEKLPERLVEAALNAVKRASPCGRWSKEMTDQLGTEQKIAIVFVCI